jgi:hypothetical protein
MSIKNNFAQIKKQLFSSNNNAIIHNKYILYIILFIALVDLHCLTVAGDFVSISIFILIAFLTTFFSKNMLVILFIAVTVTNILKYGSNIRQEGFEEGASSKQGEKEDFTEEDYKKMKYTNSNSNNKEKEEKEEREEKEEKEEREEKEEKNKTSGEINPSEIVGKLKDIITILKS